MSSPERGRSHSIQLNRVAWILGEALGYVGPTDEAVHGDAEEWATEAADCIDDLEAEIERLRTALSRQTHVSIPEDIGMVRWDGPPPMPQATAPLWRFPDD